MRGRSFADTTWPGMQKMPAERTLATEWNYHLASEGEASIHQ
jgi:hypothetical protein